tara:strand:+ start:373 stop:861 length:489 start_codon:yes stop_codon:yes gene_type:complete
MYKFNRYPLCSLVYFEAAKMLGYDNDEAASMAQGRASFFAAAKWGFKNKHKVVDNPNINLVDSVPFAGIPAFILPAGAIEGVDGIRCCTRDGDKVHQPSSYYKNESKIEKLVGVEGLEKLRKFVRNGLKNIEVNSNDVYKFYKNNRDKARMNKFYEDVLLPA